MPPLAYIAANAEVVLEGVPNCEGINKQNYLVITVMFEYVKTAIYQERNLVT